MGPAGRSRAAANEDRPMSQTDNRRRNAAATPSTDSGEAAGSSSSGAPDAMRGASVLDRRSGIDRRAAQAAAEGGDGDTGLERRRGPGRRRSDFAKAAEEGEMTAEQFLFVMAIDAFKRANGRMFPTWTDVLEVIRLLGY